MVYDKLILQVRNADEPEEPEDEEPEDEEPEGLDEDIDSEEKEEE